MFTAELSAIRSCLSQLAQRSSGLNYILLTDSLSSLLSIQDPYSSDPIIQRIHIILNSLTSTLSSVVFIWIPAHVGYSDHDKVDQAAKDSTLLPTIMDPSPSPSYDLKKYYHSRTMTAWHNLWIAQPQKGLRLIKNKFILWSTSNRNSRHEEVIFSRLRIGHTRLTHSYLLQNLHPPSCGYCQADNLSVQHLFSCPVLHNQRDLYNVPPTLSATLCNNTDKITNSLNYHCSAYFFSML